MNLRVQRSSSVVIYIYIYIYRLIDIYIFIINVIMQLRNSIKVERWKGEQNSIVHCFLNFFGNKLSFLKKQQSETPFGITSRLFV